MREGPCVGVVWRDRLLIAVGQRADWTGVPPSHGRRSGCGWQKVPKLLNSDIPLLPAWWGHLRRFRACRLHPAGVGDMLSAASHWHRMDETMSAPLRGFAIELQMQRIGEAAPKLGSPPPLVCFLCHAAWDGTRDANRGRAASSLRRAASLSGQSCCLPLRTMSLTWA